MAVKRHGVTGGEASQRHPRGRISEAEAQKQELVMCRTGKQVGSAEEKEKESSKVRRRMKGLETWAKADELDQVPRYHCLQFQEPPSIFKSIH